MTDTANTPPRLACPNCQETGSPGDLRVQETRTSPEVIYRTRKCRCCGWKFTTQERISEHESIPNRFRRPREHGATS